MRLVGVAKRAAAAYKDAAFITPETEMFETLHKATLDKIFVLMAEYAADPRTNKIDLGVGVYKDEKNNTPIMSAVRKAEQRIHDSAKTKTYKGVVGNKEFSAAVVDLALAGAVDNAAHPLRQRRRRHRRADDPDERARPRAAQGQDLHLRPDLAQPLAAGRKRQPGAGDLSLFRRRRPAASISTP